MHRLQRLRDKVVMQRRQPPRTRSVDCVELSSNDLDEQEFSQARSKTGTPHPRCARFLDQPLDEHVRKRRCRAARAHQEESWQGGGERIKERHLAAEIDTKDLAMFATVDPPDRWHFRPWGWGEQVYDLNGPRAMSPAHSMAVSMRKTHKVALAKFNPVVSSQIKPTATLRNDMEDDHARSRRMQMGGDRRRIRGIP